MPRWFLFALAMPFCAAQANAACVPEQLASLDMTMDSDGEPVVSGTVNGEPHQFVVEISGPSSWISHALAVSLGMPPTPGLDNDRGHFVRASEIKLGNAVVTDFPLRDGTLPSAQLAGGLGLKFWRNFDVELDYAAMKLRLYRSNTCPAFGAPWTTSYWTLPLEMQPSGHAMTHMMLDGRDVLTSFALRPHATMRTNVMTPLYGITTTSDGVHPSTAINPNMLTTVPRYTYRFKKLVAGGLEIPGPEVLFADDSGSPVCDGTPHDFGKATILCYSGGSLYLGMDQLRAMDLYFAFAQNKLFVTAAGVH